MAPLLFATLRGRISTQSGLETPDLHTGSGRGCKSGVFGVHLVRLSVNDVENAIVALLLAQVLPVRLGLPCLVAQRRFYKRPEKRCV